MCIAVPAKIIDLEGSSANIEYLGVRKKVDITLLPDAKKGDYVIVHAGFAIQIIEENEAKITIEQFEGFLE
jgi:hydrogenase expression/formation protein HypC